MILNNKNIVLDSDPKLREKCEEVIFPLSQLDLELGEALRRYVIDSVDEEKAELLDLSPAVGIAAPQVGFQKRMCAIYFENEPGEKPTDLVLINPKVIAHSVEQIFLESGEACLSVREKQEGYVPRFAYIKIRYTDLKGRTKTHEAYDFEAIVIQHEIDHLDGVLFYDHINQLDPFKVPANTHPL